MHIVQLLPELNQGGVERGTVELSRELAKRGHQSTVISAGGKLVSQIKQDGGQHITLDVCSKNPLTFPFRVHKLRTTISKLRPDILHARSRVPAWLAWFANKKLRIPFVTTVHGCNSVSKYSAIMTKGDAVICVSNPTKEYIQKNYGTPDEKITVIHRGIDPAEFDPEKLDHAWIENFKAQHSLNGKFIATAVGRITELKDYETFIRGISICAADIPNIKGVIIGGVRHDKQAYFDRLKTLLKELNVEERIVFAGSHNHMPEIYALSDVLISCSKKPESFGRTLIEALSMNTPIVATKHGGPLDIIKTGINGYFFTPEHPSELAQQLAQLPRLEEEYRKAAITEFSLQRLFEKTLSVYGGLLTAQQETTGATNI